MIPKKNVVILFIIPAVIAISCTKNHVTDSNSDFLRFSHATVHIANRQRAKGVVLIESNIAWKLSVEAPVPDWMLLNKDSGNNTDTLMVTAAKDNNTGGYRFATIVAIPVNNGTVSPVRLTVVQYDSTHKGNRQFAKMNYH